MSDNTEKTGSLALALDADSGYQSRSKGIRVSVQQWADISAICHDRPTAREASLEAQLVRLQDQMAGLLAQLRQEVKTLGAELARPAGGE